MGLVEPLGELVQFAGKRVNVSCNTEFALFGVHEIEARPTPTGTMVSMGGSLMILRVKLVSVPRDPLPAYITTIG